MSQQRPRKVVQQPTEKMPPDHLGVLLAGVLLMALGWFGVYSLVTQTEPYVGPRLAFFILFQIAVTGTVIPFVRYLNIRFTPIDVELPPGGVIVRQSIWLGLFVTACAWLQVLRVLNLPIAFLVGLIFLVLEIFLRSREIQNERED